MASFRLGHCEPHPAGEFLNWDLLQCCVAHLQPQGIVRYAESLDCALQRSLDRLAESHHKETLSFRALAAWRWCLHDRQPAVAQVSVCLNSFCK